MGVSINDSGTVKTLTAKLSGFTINGIDQIADNHRACDHQYGTSVRYYSLVDIERDYDYYFVKINSGLRQDKGSILPFNQSAAGAYIRTSNIALYTKAECKISKITLSADRTAISIISPEPVSGTGLSFNNCVALILDEDAFPNQLVIYGYAQNWDQQTATPIPGVSIWGIY